MTLAPDTEPDGYDVLLVEDDPDDGELTLRALRKAGVTRVRWARDGEEALAALSEIAPLPGAGLGETGPLAPHARPGLVLLDLQLPRRSGVEVLHALQGAGRLTTLPVVVFTSSQLAEDRLRCLALGAREVITKPVDSDAFAAVVHGLVRRWLEPAR